MEQVLLDDNILGVYKGAIAETYVLQALLTNEINPYYWEPNQNTELDIIFQTNKGDILGIEVKAGEGKKFKNLKNL